MTGTVYLVGAGPGDPSLLTLRAAELLATAEVVAHDALISSEILALACSEATLVNVGRRVGARAPRADGIDPRVVGHVGQGRDVVRLKSGDPMVFGRGGEEAEALAALGIRFQFVPGVSSALGAASYAGIPLTHRTVSSNLVLATGHRAGDELPRFAAGNTAAIYMSGRRIGPTCRKLIASGHPPATPAAIVSLATSRRQTTTIGTLADLPARTACTPPPLPALVIVGDVVAVSDSLQWVAGCPLRGRTIAVARARSGPSALSRQLRRLGATVVELPRLTAHATVDQVDSVVAAVDQLDRAAPVVFGCRESVRTLEPAAWSGVDARPRVAIGAAAAAALDAAGRPATTITRGACADALDAHPWNGPLLLLTSSRGRPELALELAARGADVSQVACYHTVRDRPLTGYVSTAHVDLVMLPSSSAAELALRDWPALVEAPAVAIGPRTAQAAQRLGITDLATVAHDDRDALVNYALVQLGALSPVPDKRARCNS